MAATPTEPAHQVNTSIIDWNAEVRKAWGVKWNEPDVEYEFSSGRKFYRRVEDTYNP